MPWLARGGVLGTLSSLWWRRASSAKGQLGLGADDIAEVASRLGWHAALAGSRRSWDVPAGAKDVLLIVTMADPKAAVRCLEVLLGQILEDCSIVALLVDFPHGLAEERLQVIDLQSDLLDCGADDVLHNVASGAALEVALAMSCARLASTRRRPGGRAVAASRSVLSGPRASRQRSGIDDDGCDGSVGSSLLADFLSEDFAASAAGSFRITDDSLSPPAGKPAPPCATYATVPGCLDAPCDDEWTNEDNTCRDFVKNEATAAEEEGQIRGRPRPPLLPAAPDAGPRKRRVGLLPRAAPTPLVGDWVAVSVTGDADLSDIREWLREIVIRPGWVVLGDGAAEALVEDEDGRVYLCGGELLLSGERLIRLGKSGAAVEFRRRSPRRPGGAR